MRQASQQIVNLRLEGKTYKQIRDLTGAPKSTISNVCTKYVHNNNELRKEHQEALYNNEEFKNTSLLNMKIGADKYYANLRTEAQNKWYNILQAHEDQTFIFYIAGLFDGEGTHSGNKIALSNSNILIVKSFIKFCSDIKAEYILDLYLHSTHIVIECERFWSSHGITFNHIRQYDTRKQKRDMKYKENFGTVHIILKNPLGFREALSKYSFSS